MRPSRRIILLGLLIGVLGALFWGGSRYPELDEKAIMGGSTRLEDPLSFETWIQPQEGDPLWKQVTFVTLNWINTNKRGMAFGLTLGAAMMSLIGLLQRRSYQSGFSNTLLGMVLGAPLGVCVNCAAPVAKGMHEAGTRLETTLAAMVSSPTLNVVVLTMVFSIFPIYMGIIKVGFTLIFILGVIPLLSRWVFQSEVVESIERGACEIPRAVPIEPGESWPQALVGASRDFASNLWFIVKHTLPLMILAGFLGALIATLVPLEWIATAGPGVVTVVLVAVVGLFLPVPMAFDVVIVAALLGAGMPVLYAMTLLFVLGIFSCYSAVIVATTISTRVAGTLFATLAGMGIVSGLAAAAYHDRELRALDRYVAGEDLGAVDPASPHVRLPDVSAAPPMGPARPAVPFELASAPEGIRVERIDDRPRSARGALPFEMKEGHHFGLELSHDFEIDDFWPPFWNGRGIASGDFNNDGWPDIAAATARGVNLYMNRDGQRFVATPIQGPPLSDRSVFVVALVDLDDDGWLDLFFSAYRGGSHYILNDQGVFRTENHHEIDNGIAIQNQSTSFGDVDHDGDLDAAFGNWFMGVVKPIPPAHAQNVIQFNDGGSFHSEELTEITGESLAIMLSDWNGDQNLDLIVGNDFEQPDVYYLGDGKGGFRELTRQDGIIPRSTLTTMSVDTGDIDNDLQLDIYVAQIAAQATGEAAHVKVRSFEEYCIDVEPGPMRDRCEVIAYYRTFFEFGPSHRPSNITRCREIEDKAERHQCMGMMLMKTAVRERDPEMCDQIPDSLRSKVLCTGYFEPGVVTSDERYQQAIPQNMNENVLLMAKGDGTFEDRAEEWGAEITGWSWAAKFGDIDNDGWQDLYVVNGTWARDVVPGSFLLMNQKDHFDERAAEFGLEDFMVVSAYTYVDFDGDGDLDIITNSVSGPLKVYVNGESRHRSISFELRDYRANRFGIGSKVIGRAGENGDASQIREIKAGSGFLSFDAPVAHFGLGEAEALRSVEIVWSTGERTTLEGPFPAGARYRIERL